jgi:hypothetical protein
VLIKLIDLTPNLGMWAMWSYTPSMAALIIDPGWCCDRG